MRFSHSQDLEERLVKLQRRREQEQNDYLEQIKNLKILVNEKEVEVEKLRAKKKDRPWANKFMFNILMFNSCSF